MIFHELHGFQQLSHLKTYNQIFIKSDFLPKASVCEGFFYS